MEDDLYGSIDNTAGAEGALDATLYEGLFAGSASSGHHEIYLQNKVNELEDLLRECQTEVQTLKAQLQARNRKLLDVTTERDILLRNISCLYNTAKAEMARKQAEISGLRAEVAQAKQQHHHHQQQEAQQQQYPQRQQRGSSPFALPAAVSGVAAAYPPRQPLPLPGGAGCKRSREPDAAADALEMGAQQAGPGSVNGGSGTYDGLAGAKRPRSDGSSRAEPPAANGAVGGGGVGAEGGSRQSSAGGYGAAQPQNDAAAAGDPAVALPGRQRMDASVNGVGGAAARAGSCERAPSDDGRVARSAPQHALGGSDRLLADLNGRFANGHVGTSARAAAGPQASAIGGGGSEGHGGGQRGSPPSRSGCPEQPPRPREHDAPSEARHREGSTGGDGRTDVQRERGQADGSSSGRGGSKDGGGGRDGGGIRSDSGGRDGGGSERGRDDQRRGCVREENRGRERGRVDDDRGRARREDHDRERGRLERDLYDERREGRGGRDADRERDRHDRERHHSRPERY